MKNFYLFKTLMNINSPKLKALVMLILFAGYGKAAFSQDTVSAVQTGLWSNPSTWSTDAVPSSADHVKIANGFSVTINATGNSCNSLLIGAGNSAGSGSLIFSGASSLTVLNNILLGDENGATATVTMCSAAVLTCAQLVEGNPVSSSLGFNEGTIVFTGSFILPAGINKFNNLIINAGLISLGSDVEITSDLTFTAGQLAINGKTLTLKGHVYNTVTGGLIGSKTSNLIMNGNASTGLSFDQTIAGVTNAVNNFTVNSEAQTITLLNALRLIGTHYPLAGVLASNGNYTIGSSGEGTGNIAEGNSNGGYITGDVTVERFIGKLATRSWRLLTSATKGQTIKQAWQENQSGGTNTKPGYGTLITSSYASWFTNGFDYKTNGASMYSFSPSAQELQPVVSTSDSIASNQGYFLYIRGSRAINPSASINAMDSTILRSKGTLNTGDQYPVSVMADKFALVGNPYASAIDMRNISTSGGCAGTSFSVWDPKLVGSYNLGGYQTLTLIDDDYCVFPGGGSYGPAGTVTNTIPSGSAFFVQASGSNGSVTVNEGSKRAGDTKVWGLMKNSTTQKFVSTLYAVNGSTKILADGTTIVFDETYSNDVDGMDSRKLSNFGENLSIRKDGKKLAIEKRKLPAAGDSISFEMNKLKQATYELAITADYLQQDNLMAFLEDSYLDTSVIIMPGSLTNYAFAVNADSASFAVGRFKILFKEFGGSLSVTIKRIKAYQQKNDAAVQWDVSSEIDILKYEIEKSTNGKDFVCAGEVAAINAASYQWLDKTPVTGVNYYRIVIRNTSGRVDKTQIVKVALSNKEKPITVFPNPIENYRMNVHFTNQVKGTYTFNIISNSGQLLYTGSLRHNGGCGSQIINIPTLIPQGNYQLEIVAPGSSRTMPVMIVRN